MYKPLPAVLIGLAGAVGLFIVTFCESVEDFDYALMLETLIKQSRQKGVDVAAAERALNDISRFFMDPVHWSQNDAYFLELRNRLAENIVKLQNELSSE